MLSSVASQGLKLDLKLLDGNTVELSGDVVVTTDGESSNGEIRCRETHTMRAYA